VEANASQPAVVGRPVIGPGQVLVLLGTLAVIVSIFLNWIEVSIGPFTISTTSSGVPVQFLWDYTTHSKDPTLLVVLIPSAVLALAAVAFIQARLLGLLGGGLAVVVSVLYSFQLHQQLPALQSLLRESARPDLFDLIGIGPMICFAGGVVIVLGALLPIGRRPATA
jgi:hypothetical protein